MRKIKDKEDKLYKENVINIQVHLRKEDEICIGIGICIERIQEYVGKVMDMGIQDMGILRYMTNIMLKEVYVAYYNSV